MSNVRIRKRTLARLSAVAGGVALVTAGGAFPAVAAGEGDVQVINTETVQAYTDATGKVQSKRLYEQLALTGEGSVSIANPVETSGLRNLNGFSGFDVEDGDQVVDIQVDGEENIRSVSDYDQDLPLEVDVSYRLDGEPISPESLVGESGELEVTYTVRNVTNRMETIRYTDGKGGVLEEQAEVMMPMVGSLTTTLPAGFRDVEAQGANMAGDGKGGTKLSYTMTLLAPLGSDTVELGYTAQVADAVAPGASVTALPVNPLDNPTLSKAATSYKGGSDTGEKLAAGATTIDQNLLKLRDGAGDLLAGIIKLRNGADQLRAGLEDEAAPGAGRLAAGTMELAEGLVKLDDGTGRLADGTEKLRDGTDQLADGAGRLDEGAGKLADGTEELDAGARRLDAGAGELADGSQRLDAGAGKIDAGAGQLASGADRARAGSVDLAAGMSGLLEGLKQLRQGVATLDATVTPQVEGSAEYKALLGALTKVIQGIGQPSDMGPGTILGGINAIQAGVNTKVAPGVAGVKAGLDDAIAASDNDPSTAVGSLEELKAGINSLETYCANEPNPAVCEGTIAALVSGVNDSKSRLTIASRTLGAVYSGLVDSDPNNDVNSVVEGLTGLNRALYNTVDCNQQTGQNCGVAQVLGLVQDGIPLLVDGVIGAVSTGLLQKIGSETADCDPTKTLLCAGGALAAGSGDLANGLGDLSTGAGELAAGTGQLADGTGRLRDGAGRLADGTGELTDGTGRLSDGAGRLADGTGELADGAGRLDAGANELADGAGRLKGGTAKAEAGSTLIADGAEKLATGLLEAAGGSGLLADGLGKAAEGAPKLVDGAQRLSDEGTKKLVEAGEATAQDYGKQYALIMAGAERAQDGKMVVGAPEDAVGLAAYSFEIRGEDGEGNRNVARALGGMALLGAGGALFALRRRFI